MTTKPTRDYSLTGLIEDMIGRKTAALTTADEELASKCTGRPLMTVEHLNCGSRPKDVSFELREGEVLGLAGLMGSGRTEVVESLFGLNKDASGQVTINGQPYEIKGVRHAIDSGLSAMGENRVQELLEKYDGLHREKCDVQFIGQLQTNKVKYLVGTADLIESVDSVELLRMIDARARKLGVTQDVLLEVNIGGEAAKSGFEPSALPEALEISGEFSSLKVRGLMAIPPVAEASGASRPYFARMRELFIDIGAKKYDNVSMDFLSMGMSGDFEDAIREGANVVRVGSAIFGPRNYGERT